MHVIILNHLRYIKSTIWLLIFVNIIGCYIVLVFCFGIATLTGIFSGMSKTVGIFEVKNQGLK